MDRTRFKWNPETDARASHLYITLGWSCGMIAKDIGAVSRNAVIGRLHRLGIKREGAATPTYTLNYPETRKPAPRPLRAPPVRGDGRSSNGFNFKTSTVTRLPPTPPRSSFIEDVTLAKPWTERRFNECTWPVSGEGEHTFSCCAPVFRMGWCGAHWARGTVPTKKPNVRYHDATMRPNVSVRA